MKLSIKQKMISGALLTLALSITVVLVGINGMGRIGSELTGFINGNSRTLFLSQKIMSDVNHSARVIRDVYINNADQKAKEGYSDELDGTIKMLDSDMKELEKLMILPSEQASFETVEKDIKEWLVIGKDIIDGLNTNDIAKANRLIIRQCPVALEKLEESAISLIQEVEDDTIQTSNRLEGFVKTQTMILFTCLIGLIVIYVAINYSVLKSILTPMRKLLGFADEIKKGNLNARCDHKSDDEMGSLSNNLNSAIIQWGTYIEDISDNLERISNGDLKPSKEIEYIGDFVSIKDAITKINTSLNETMARIKMSSEQVAGGSVQVASGSSSLAQGSSQQANSVEELATSIVQISDQVNSNADNSKAANEMSITISEKINYSNQQMQKMMVAMESITKKSNEINKIIKTIEDIAFNTNILALNAAVEAARAGTAGKGFAVVADEVRNLASKSSEAAKNTTKLIEDSIKAVEDGTQIANKTAQSLYDVVNGASEIIDFVSKIAVSSEEQAGSISQVTIGIDQISSVVQINSATSEEIAAASEQLREQANILKSLVSKFKLSREFEKSSDNNKFLSQSNGVTSNEDDDYFEDYNIISKY